MIHQQIPIQVQGSLPDTCLTTYILDNSAEMNRGHGRPLILVCPGGAYRFTSDREAELVAIQFNSMGYHAAVLRYSCAPAVFPTAVTEVAASVKLLRSKVEEWNIDANRIFVMGFSAGGHLAASYGVFWNREFLSETLSCRAEELRPSGLILCYPVITSNKEYGHEESIRNLLGSSYEEKKEEMALENQVGSHVPPTFLWHTFADETVPFQNSVLFVEALGRVKVPAEFHLFPEGEHGLSLADESTLRADGTGLQKQCQSWIFLLKIWLRHICGQN